MFSIAELLDRAKAGGNIESDYRLAKVIGITHSAISLYRTPGNKQVLPGDKVIAQLCALSGDDPQLIFAQVQELKASTDAMRNFWSVMVKRLAGGATTAILSVCFAIALIALPAQDARASTVDAYKTGEFSLLYIVSNTILSVQGFLLVRLRRAYVLFRLFSPVCLP